MHFSDGLRFGCKAGITPHIQGQGKPKPWVFLRTVSRNHGQWHFLWERGGRICRAGDPFRVGVVPGSETPPQRMGQCLVLKTRPQRTT